jgi:Ni/Fe-hydrogenase 1 B-type cytochrome subunit
MSSSNVHDLARFEAEQISQARSFKSVYVYQAPIRIWHWVNALAFCVLAVTGWLIASPLPSPGGEASSHHMMGTLRYLHFSAGYIMAFGLLGRIYWAFVGNQFARELFWLPLFQLPYWKDLWSMLKWYAFASQSPHQYMGHNPLARLIMFSLFLCPTVLMVLTGFAMYAEGQGADTWFDGLFGWVTPLFGSSQDVHTWHHLGLWGAVTPRQLLQRPRPRRRGSGLPSPVLKLAWHGCTRTSSSSTSSASRRVRRSGGQRCTRPASGGA